MRPIQTSIITLLLGTAASAQKSSISRAESALDTLQSWYNETTGIWDTCGWWNGANCMTVLADLALVDENPEVQQTAREVFNNTYHVAPGASNPRPMTETPSSSSSSSSSSASSSSPSATLSSGPSYKSIGLEWVDGSYDDDGWWALAWIAAYDLTKKREYLDVAIGIHDLLASTKHTNCGNGGLYVDPNNGYINAIVNELFLSIAAHLANRAPNGQKYLKRAQQQWDWFSKSGMINENGTINDGLANCQNNGQPEWSYNQGVILGALVELHHASSSSLNTNPSTNTTYLESATHIAKAAIRILTDSNHVVRESCDPNSCDANSTQFKGIFIRNLRLLHSVAPDHVFEAVIRASAKSIWENDRDGESGELGEDWRGKDSLVDASTHSSAMDALVADIGI